MKEAMYRGPSASSLANSASSTDTLLATGTNAASASAPDLASKGQALPPQYRWGQPGLELMSMANVQFLFVCAPTLRSPCLPAIFHPY